MSQKVGNYSFEGLFQRGRPKEELELLMVSCVYGSCIAFLSDSSTCLSRRCSSLSLWMALSCSGLIPFHLSVRTRGGRPPPTSLSAASAHSVIMSDVSVCHVSARFSLSSLLCCSFSFSSRSAACGGTGRGEALPPIQGRVD